MWTRILLAAGTLLLTSCSGGYYLNFELEVREDGQWVEISNGCTLVDPGPDRTGGGLGAPEAEGPEHFAIETLSTRGKAWVTISTASSSEELVFDRAFLKSEDVEVTLVTTDAGTQYRVTHFGARKCLVSEPEGLESTAGAAGAGSLDAATDLP